jgi:hypothetical protein
MFVTICVVWGIIFTSYIVSYSNDETQEDTNYIPQQQNEEWELL